MPISSRGSFRAFVCILAGLVLTQPARAQGDDTNARLITDGTVWAESMQQVMGGTSLTLSASTIRGPAGIYANVLLSPNLLKQAQNLACPTPLAAGCPIEAQLVDTYLTNYFLYLLENPAVSGILLQAQWQDLSPVYPGDPPNPSFLRLDYIDAAFNAISAWNKQNPTMPKTLQLDLTPGFNSPTWLFDEIDAAAGGPGAGSCDGLFYSPAAVVSSLCGYTTIFHRTESPPTIQLPLPLPWNPTYKHYWKAFLSALSQHIASDPDYVSSFVSIGVAGPTASSTEIILPNGKGDTTTNLNAGTLTLPCNGISCTSADVDVFHAWDDLLANNYSENSSYYVDSDRAFIEEWATAIDVYGQLFSGVTLEVATGGDQLPDFPSPSNPSLLDPPFEFQPDCGKNSMATMGCSAETAIVAYFAGPPVGGANAKSTAEYGLIARGINNRPLSGASVKWLSENTPFPLSVLNPSSGSSAVVSRMLGGLQLAKQFSDETPDPSSGFSPMQDEGCLTTPPCPMTPEQALLNVLQAYFQGTSVATAFGTGLAMNGTETIVDARINYLQIWDSDILYAAGLQNCTTKANIAQLLSQPPITGKPPACHVPITATASLGGVKYTAQDLLNLASYAILNYTQEPVTDPVCGCTPPYVPRNAFLGDAVCVTQTEQMQAAADNATAPSNYSINYTAPPVSPYTVSIPYGLCRSSIITFSSLVYRQAYMGDYVCVSFSQAAQVAADNAAFPTRGLFFCPGAPLPPRFPPLPLPPELPLPGFPLPGPPGPLLGAPLPP